MESRRNKRSVQEQKMVPLKDRQELYAKCGENAAQLAFVQWIFGDHITVAANDLTQNTSDIVRNAVLALSNDSKRAFAKIYESFAKRKPNKNSPWIYDDILVCTLTIGIAKFSIDQQPLNAVIALRKQATDDKSRAITEVFENALENTLEMTGRMSFIRLCISNALGQNFKLSNTSANTIYNEAISILKDTSHNLFLRLCALKSCDIIVTLKDLETPGRLNAMEHFVDTFQRRTHQIGAIVYVSVLCTIFAYFMHKYATDPAFNIKNWSHIVGNVANIFGILSFIGIAITKRHIEDGISRFIFFIFGYNRKKLASK